MAHRKAHPDQLATSIWVEEGPIWFRVPYDEGLEKWQEPVVEACKVLREAHRSPDYNRNLLEWFCDVVESGRPFPLEEGWGNFHWIPHALRRIAAGENADKALNLVFTGRGRRRTPEEFQKQKALVLDIHAQLEGLQANTEEAIYAAADRVNYLYDTAMSIYYGKGRYPIKWNRILDFYSHWKSIPMIEQIKQHMRPLVVVFLELDDSTPLLVPKYDQDEELDTTLGTRYWMDMDEESEG